MEQLALVTAAAQAAHAAATPAEPAAHISKLSAKLPTFWTSNPRAWFVQAEASLRKAAITRQATMTDHVITALPEAVTISVVDLLEQFTPDSDDSYTRLKERLLGKFTPSKFQLLNQLVDHPDLGDRKPSSMMDEMLALLPTGEPAGELFQTLFLRRLPLSMREHLGTEDFEDAREMADRADQIWAARATGHTTVAAVSRHQQPRHSSPSPHRQPAGGRQTRERPDHGMCFYHAKFGSKASKCEPPCSQAGNAKGRRN